MQGNRRGSRRYIHVDDSLECPGWSGAESCHQWGIGNMGLASLIAAVALLAAGPLPLTSSGGDAPCTIGIVETSVSTDADGVSLSRGLAESLRTALSKKGSWRVVLASAEDSASVRDCTAKCPHGYFDGDPQFIEEHVEKPRRACHSACHFPLFSRLSASILVDAMSYAPQGYVHVALRDKTGQGKGEGALLSVPISGDAIRSFANGVVARMMRELQEKCPAVAKRPAKTPN